MIKEENMSDLRVGHRIKDRKMVAQGFGLFSSSSVRSDGQAMIFEYPAGARYEVPLDYILEWVSEFGASNSQGTTRSNGGVRIKRSRLVSEKRFARMYLSDGSSYDLAWDTVLMACEPLYEHYGGLTQTAQEVTQRWADAHGSFCKYNENNES